MSRRLEGTGPIRSFFAKPYRYAAVFSLILAAVFVFMLLDAFVIPRTLQTVPQVDVLPAPSAIGQTPATGDASGTGQPAGAEGGAQAAPVVTDTSYKDGNIEVSLETLHIYDTDVYIADVKVSSIAYLKAAFAHNAYGRNLNDKTSVIAGEQNAVLAINGDFYGFRDDGWVLRNGILYRSGGSDDALLMDTAGNLSCSGDRDLIEAEIPGLWQIWSFGPPLVVDGAVSVTKGQEIAGRSSNSNPRAALGQVGERHYLFIVSDGRTSTSAGLSLYELATLFKERGCFVAYNLDGGGSATLYFNGRVVNRPTTNGRTIEEREVSDIVYVGY